MLVHGSVVHACNNFDLFFYVSRMASMMNTLLLRSALEKLGIQVCVQSALKMHELSEPYNRRRALRHLGKGRVVIFGGIDADIGNYLFPTDIVAALRASECMILPWPIISLFSSLSCYLLNATSSLLWCCF